jgi:hypothetical protein
VVHRLQFSCEVQLQTPAGFSEITISVPGTIEGTFQSSEVDSTAELKSVTINLDTKILASMVEKSCRTIVRSSVEKAMTQPEEIEDSEEGEVLEESTLTPAANSYSAREESFTLLSPPGNSNMDSAVFVTPRNVFASDDSMRTPSPKVLLPIPDDFDDTTDKPRRISPQPSSHGFMSSSDMSPFAPRTAMKRSSPTLSEDGGTTTNVKRRLPLISPLASHDARKFHEVPENGPSLPMLVEVACRAMYCD